ncbi:ferrochelatase, partial [Bacillus paralicheniformis]|uniref:ferrochelatase n=1 Tax=Bacillus paralicheniformis TaxID=1648923 RepID=UPI0020BFEC9F
SYVGRLPEEAEKLGNITIHGIDSWYKEPKFIQYWVDAVKGIYNGMSDAEREKAVLIVSAHSLPEKIIAMGDPYPDQLKQTADYIALSFEVANYA